MIAKLIIYFRLLAFISYLLGYLLAFKRVCGIEMDNETEWAVWNCLPHGWIIVQKK